MAPALLAMAATYCQVMDLRRYRRFTQVGARGRGDDAADVGDDVHPQQLDRGGLAGGTAAPHAVTNKLKECV